MILDSLRQIEMLDKNNTLDTNYNSFRLLMHEWEEIKIQQREYQNIVIIGMGGSAHWADFVRFWPYISIPLLISRDYELPKYVSKNSLLIFCSYSGNTEETISALEQAIKAKYECFILCSGGSLQEIAEAHEIPFFKLPKVSQPRYSTMYFISSFCTLLNRLGIIEEKYLNELTECSAWLEENILDLHYTVPSSRNPAKKLALEMCGKSVVIYASSQFAAVAKKFKIAINENAKNIAWYNELPEFCHNEFIGWGSHPIDKIYSVIEIRSNLDHPQINKRFEIINKLLSGKMPYPETLQLKGETVLKQTLYGMVFSEMTSLYLALLNGQDPDPVELVEKLKKLL